MNKKNSLSPAPPVYLKHTTHVYNPTCKQAVCPLRDSFITLHKCTSLVGNSLFATSQLLWQHLLSHCGSVCVCVCVCVCACWAQTHSVTALQHANQNESLTHRCSHCNVCKSCFVQCVSALWETTVCRTSAPPLLSPEYLSRL